MSSMLKKSVVGSQFGGRPPAAVELSPEGVLAAALPAAGSRRGASEAGCVYAFVPLQPGALVPSLDEPDKPNLRAPEAVASAIRSALSQVAPRARAVTLVLPDTLVRVFVLDFDSMPAKTSEAVSVVRFRLRKMVPFDVEPAGVSYQVLAQNESECKVLAAVVPGPILAEYEAAVRDAEIGRVVEHAVHSDLALRRNDPLASAHQRVDAGRVAFAGKQVAGQRAFRAGTGDDHRHAEFADGLSQLHRRHDMAAGRVEQHDAVHRAGADMIINEAQEIIRAALVDLAGGRDDLRAIRAAMADAERHHLE